MTLGQSSFSVWISHAWQAAHLSFGSFRVTGGSACGSWHPLVARLLKEGCGDDGWMEVAGGSHCLVDNARSTPRTDAAETSFESYRSDDCNDPLVTIIGSVVPTLHRHHCCPSLVDMTYIVWTATCSKHGRYDSSGARSKASNQQILSTP